MPLRIVALAAEVPAILDRIGAWDALVGVSAHARTPQKVRGLPRVGGFARPDLEKVLALAPDLVIATSCVQAEAAALLAREGVSVLVLSPHRLEDVFASILLVGGIVGRRNEAERLVDAMRAELVRLRKEARLTHRVRAFFEEWPDPLIAGIGWVSDLMEWFGAEDVCRDKAIKRDPKARMVDARTIAARRPEVVLASWCGRRVRLAQIRNRPGWAQVPAVQKGHVFALPSEQVLQWGPQLVEGARLVRDALLAAARA